MDSFDTWKFLAAIAIFIYAMWLIEQSVKVLAGRPFKKFLQQQSKSAFKMFFASIATTAFLQSSSVLLLIVLSFVGAGLMNLRGALAAVLGSNIGTTLDSWVIALVGFKINFSYLSYPLLSVALVGLLFINRRRKLFYLTYFLIGFALVFLSLEWFKECLDREVLSAIGTAGSIHYLWFIPVGLLITAIIQSSLITVAITLSALYNNLLPFESAAAIVIGSELGTTLKFLLGSAQSNTDKKRVALGNFILNIITIVLAVILMHPLIYFIRNILGISDSLTALVFFQTGINIMGVVSVFPFLGKLADSLQQIVPAKSHSGLCQHIGDTNAVLPSEALMLSEKEIVNLIDRTIHLSRNIFGIYEKDSHSFLGGIKSITSGKLSFAENYEQLKTLEGEILEYITAIYSGDLTEPEVVQKDRQINIIRHVLRSMKNLKDIRHNLDEFKSSANDSLFSFYQQIQERSRNFYNHLEAILNDSNKMTEKSFGQLNNENRFNYDSALSLLVAAVKEGKIMELDSANLINVYREVYSSNKALLRALADLKIPGTDE